MTTKPGKTALGIANRKADWHDLFLAEIMFGDEAKAACGDNGAQKRDIERRMIGWTVYGVNLELVDVWRIDVEAEDAAQALKMARDALAAAPRDDIAGLLIEGPGPWRADPG